MEVIGEMTTQQQQHKEDMVKGVCVCVSAPAWSVTKRDLVDGEGKYHSQNDHGDDDAADADS